MPDVDVGPLAPGEMRLVEVGTLTIGVYNCAGKLHAIEDRCSHDDGPLCEGDWEPEACVVVCPRHGSRFDLGHRYSITNLAQDRICERRFRSRPDP